jgi:hypothetical protein
LRVATRTGAVLKVQRHPWRAFHRG